jgi:hypothetical protein
VDYRWRLREVMAQRGMFVAAELAPAPAAHGIDLSDPQVCSSHSLWTRSAEML